MPQILCKICAKEFYAKPNWIKNGWGKYCSKTCQFKGQKNGKLVVCFTCRATIYRSKSDLVASQSKKYFCGKSCQTRWRNSVVYIGSNHWNWTNGRSAYRNILSRNKISPVCKRCREKDFRILAVHHLDRNRENNKIENLIWLCHNCHFLIHHDNIEKQQFMETLV